MIRNSKYVYGDETLEIPVHIHFGKEMLNRMMEYEKHTALINAETNQTMTFGDLAQKTVDIALSLTHMGVGKGDVISISSEMRIEIIPTVLGVICAGASFLLFSVSDGPETLNLSRPKVMFLSLKNYKLYKKAFDAVGSIEKYIIYDIEYNESKESENYNGCIIKNDDGNQNGCKIIIRNGDRNQNDYKIKNGDENQNGLQIKNGNRNQNSSCELQDGGIWFNEFLTETAKVADFVPTPVDGWKDIGLIKFSSGTTGAKKCVPNTHLATFIDTYSRAHKRFKYSKILITRDWGFSSGATTTLSYLRQGTTCVFTRNQSVDTFLQAIQTYKVLVVQAVPTLVDQLCKSTTLHKYDVSSVQYFLSGTAPLAKKQVQHLKKRFVNVQCVYQVYGMTEAGTVCNSLHAHCGPRDGSVGLPSHGFIIKVVDVVTREAVGCNQRGEICFRSPTLTPGYVGGDSNDRLKYDSEGFYLTGDVGYYDTDGYFYIVDRVKHIFKYNNNTIYPVEMEAVLSSLPQVVEAGIAVVDGKPAAAVVLQPGATIAPTEIAHYLHSMVPFFQLEGGVYFVNQLPRIAGNKLSRKKLPLILNDIINNKNTIGHTYK